MQAVPALCPHRSDRLVDTGKGGIHLFLTAICGQYPWQIKMRQVKSLVFHANSAANIETQQHNHAGMWTDKPMSCVRKDLLKWHGESVMHRNAEDRERPWLSLNATVAYGWRLRGR